MAVRSLLRETASRWSGHKASLLGAAIAYYSVFSLGPLMVIAIAIAGFVFGDVTGVVPPSAVLGAAAAVENGGTRPTRRVDHRREPQIPPRESAPENLAALQRQRFRSCRHFQ
jgi:hypothetical protein